MTLHESSQQLNAQGLKFDAVNNYINNNNNNNTNMMQQPAYQSLPENHVQYPPQQCVPQSVPQHDISQQYVAQNITQQYPPQLLPPEQLPQQSLPQQYTQQLPQQLPLQQLLPQQLPLQQLLPQQLPQQFPPPQYLSQQNIPQQYPPQQNIPQYIPQQSIPQYVPQHIPQHDLPPQDILQHIPHIIPVQQNIIPPQDIAPQNVNIPPQDILQQFIPPPQQNIPLQQNITLQENIPPQNVSLQNIPTHSISPQHTQQDISPQHVQQNISPEHIHQNTPPQNVPHTMSDITLGNRNMTIKCNVQRRGCNYYHSVVDPSGKELYELVTVNKSLVLQNQAKDDAVSTRSKFPHRKFALDILAEDGPHMAEYSTKIRHHKVSVTVDDVVYCRLKSSKSHGHEKRREWAAAGTLTPVALQVGKHDLTFYPNCSDAVEKAILFAVCHKCLQHDNS